MKEVKRLKFKLDEQAFSILYPKFGYMEVKACLVHPDYTKEECVLVFVWGKPETNTDGGG